MDPDDTQPPKPPIEEVSGPRRVLYLGLAGFFFVLAVLGVMLPVLPCTPFLLLTSYFLVRCSQRLNHRLLESRLFGPLLREWQHHRRVQPHIKISAIVIMVLSVAATLYLTDFPLVVQVAVMVLAVIGLYVITNLPSK